MPYKDITGTKDIVKTTRIRRLSGDVIAKLLMQFFRYNKINKVYSENNNKNGIEFIESIISQLEIKFDINDEEIKRIPKEGAFLIVSNNPFGGIDGILLLKILLKIRPDLKIFPNFILEKIDRINDYILPDNPFELNNRQSSRRSALKKTLSHLKEGKPLGIFPASEVFHYKNIITDKY